MRRVFLLFLYFFFTTLSCKTIKEPTVKAVNKIPYFTFTTLEHKRFTQDSFDKKRTKLLFYFNSECDHCEKQGKRLSKKIDLFNNLELTFISFEEIDAIKKYRDKFNFNRKNITFIQDSRLTFSNKFGVKTFPSILIYSKEGKLIKKFEGETKIKDITPFILD